MITVYDSTMRQTTYTFPNKVVVVVPDTVSKTYNFANQNDDVSGIVTCIGEAIGLSNCDVDTRSPQKKIAAEKNRTSNWDLD